MEVAAFESDAFVADMAATWKGLKPLYEQLHAYVRSKLIKRWPKQYYIPTNADTTRVIPTATPLVVISDRVKIWAALGFFSLF